SGIQHLEWGTGGRDYIKAMAEVTPLREHTTHTSLRELNRQPEPEVWHLKIATFVDYLLNEDSRYCSVGGHEAFAGQLQLEESLKGAAEDAARVASDAAAGKTQAK
ncbi:MAG: hypothetical protein M3O70_28810, partial [Actinomycetota bacterium]|nr:hypothetical protein [Actinomycetota bacterium]